MKRLALFASAVLLALGAHSAQAGFVLSGSSEIHGQNTTANVGDWIQVGQVATGGHGAFAFGTFSSYTADPGDPQITGGDLNKYGYSMLGTVDTVNTVTHTITYSGTMWVLAPGYGFTNTDTQYLEKSTFSLTAQYDAAWATAVVTGSFLAEAGTRQPVGPGGTWPTAIDFSQDNPGSFLGSFTSGSNILTGTITAPSPVVPEPATMSLIGLGMAGAGFIRRRRRA